MANHPNRSPKERVYKGAKIVQSEEWDPRESDPDQQMTRRYRFHYAKGMRDAHGASMGYADTVKEAKERIDASYPGEPC